MANITNAERRTNVAWLVFVPTIFSSACLLFFVQPLFAKMVLPLLGGAPAVWATAMLFFQSALIGGYAYAHFLSKYLGVLAQIAVHLALWGCAAFALPLAVPSGWTYDPTAPAAFQTLVVFAAGVGLPFFALSANAPLIQHWYAQLPVQDATNPYVLYGASNLGSLAALLAYPLIAEPLWGARAISSGWAIGFVALGLVLALAAFMAARAQGYVVLRTTPEQHAIRKGPSFRTIGNWLLLAFVPSSLMLVITTKISTDVGSLPLIWVIPLSLYLLTFVLVFSDSPIISNSLLKRGLPFALGLLAVPFAQMSGADTPVISAALMVAGFFFAALWAHRRLYEARPNVEHLTLFYLVMSIGGAMGGLFNSIIAPWLFNDLYEGPSTLIILALAAYWTRSGKSWVNKVAYGAFCAIFAFGLIRYLPNLSSILGHNFAALIAVALVMCISIFLRKNAPGFLVFLVATLFIGNANQQGEAMLADRSFFGTHKVIERDGLRLYANGTTLHGSQSLQDLDKARPAPRAYYHERAPMAQVMQSEFGQSARRIGIVGLGVGALACYAQPGQTWVYYEIDDKVLHIARDTGHFSFLENCTPDAPVHIGDARIVLENQSDALFDILVIDAYSSDAVPVHLTTKEALSLYRDRLAPNGILVMHISNRYYKLDQPIVRAASQLGMTAIIQHYEASGDETIGDRSSVVVALSRNASDLAPIRDQRWSQLTSDGQAPWTDDFANPLASLKTFSDVDG